MRKANDGLSADMLNDEDRMKPAVTDLCGDVLAVLTCHMLDAVNPEDLLPDQAEFLQC